MKKKTIALASAMIVSATVPSRATSSCSALISDDPGGEHRDRAARLEPRGGDAERDVEREHAGAVGLDEREHERAGARSRRAASSSRVGSTWRVRQTIPNAEQRDVADQRGEHEQPAPVQRRRRGSVLQRGRRRPGPPAPRRRTAGSSASAGRTPPTIGRARARAHRRAGGSAAQPGGGGRLGPRADDGRGRPAPSVDGMLLPRHPHHRPARGHQRPRPARRATATSRPCAASTSTSARGEILALLGPNGAGKTSTVEVLEGFRAADRRRGRRARRRPARARRAPGASGSASCCRSPRPS